MNQITHNNHFVPQLYLKQWSNDGLHIWEYRTLVSHEGVPEWIYRSISQVAYQRDLYTIQFDGKDIDDFEKWLAAEFENPVENSIRKVLKDNPLLPMDWECLAKFLGAQDIRTPLNYLESTEQWENKLPELLEDSLEKSIRIFEQKKEPDKKNISSELENSLFENVLEIQTVPQSESELGKGYVRAEITVGRRLWLQSQRYLLTKTVNALKNHKWSIVRPARGYQWFTSDHPVVKLNYYGKGNYDLKGGWGNKGANIFMPISPRHLLFTEIGKDIPDRLAFSSEKTREIQSLIAERAFRSIFAHKSLKTIKNMRPRDVNAELFSYESDQWKNWHEYQNEVEVSKKKNS